MGTRSHTAITINILSKKEDNLEEEETVQEYPLVDKPYYVDTIAYKGNMEILQL